MENTIRLEPGTLWPLTRQQTERAIATGALQSIATDHKFVEDAGIRFLVRILGNIARKETANRQQSSKREGGKEFNPFLPYEEDLFVTDISDTHLCLLNKYNVVDHHLLIVTREFEEQESFLNEADFLATLTCLSEFDGLAFYNAGRTSGASQRHKHLQLIPLPISPDGTRVPIASHFATEAQFTGHIGTIASFPFAHALVLLEPGISALTLSDRYRAALDAVGIGELDGKPSAPYNWLATREWMFLVPRSQEGYEAISINSLGFAGALLVRNSEQLQQLKRLGPLSVLSAVARPR